MVDAASGDTVNFAHNLGCSTITLTSGDIEIATDLSIVGPGPTALAVSGNDASQVFVVDSDSTATVSGLTIDNGGNFAGAGISNSGTLNLDDIVVSKNGTGNPNDGGGVLNNGTLTVSDSSFSENSGWDGGGIANYAALSVADSTFSGNNAGGAGGGIFNYKSSASVSDSTFSGNSTLPGAVGGGIYNDSGSLTLESSTISGNGATLAGGIYNNSTLLAEATIVANSSSGGDCSGFIPTESPAHITDGGYNIDDDGSCGFSPVNHSQSGVDPDLGPLQENGGPTDTLLPALTSPAVGVIPTITTLNAAQVCPRVDQRGVASVGNCTIGAVEVRSTQTTWIQLSPATSPPARDFASMAYDPASGGLVLFGGSSTGDGEDLNDTWVWKSGDWIEKTPATSPSPRERAAMAYDAATGQLVLFGGGSSGGFLNDTWVWNGQTWIQQHPAVSPSPRGQGSMVYDPATQQLSLFGGGPGPGMWFGDTWVWKGTTWKQLSPATSPSPRVGAAVTYDPITRQVVLFGGYANNGTEYNDTWTWNGTTWTNQATTTAPSTRVNAALAFDPTSGQVVLFGGTIDDYAVLGDTWIWNGTKWTLLNPAVSPDPRGYAQFALDDATNQLILFGGFGSSSGSSNGTLDDTWTFSNPSFPSCAAGLHAHVLSATYATGTFTALFCVNAKGFGTYTQGILTGFGSVTVVKGTTIIGAVGKNLLLAGTTNGTKSSFVELAPTPIKFGTFTLTMIPAAQTLCESYGGTFGNDNMLTFVSFPTDLWTCDGYSWVSDADLQAKNVALGDACLAGGGTEYGDSYQTATMLAYFTCGQS